MGAPKPPSIYDKQTALKIYNCNHRHWGRTKFELKTKYPELFTAMEKFKLLGTVPDRRAYHTKERQAKPIRSFKCDRCGRGFFHEGALTTHLKDHDTVDRGGKVSHEGSNVGCVLKLIRGLK